MKNVVKNIKNRLLRYASLRFARKRTIGFMTIIVLFAFIPLLFASCDVGLGEEVDLESPEIIITSHSDNDTVPSEFLLSGTAKDNEEVTEIKIDFESQNLHYLVKPGQTWQKKTKSSNDSWISVDSTEGSCVKNGSIWTWNIYVRSSEGNENGSTYNFTATARDAMGNSGKKSKEDLSLILDEKNPDVIIYKPELLTGEYSSVSEKAQNYSLCDGNVISNLFNGDLTFYVRQGGSISFKELNIEFDSGELSSGTRKVTGDADAKTSAEELAKSVSFEGDEEVTVYFSKTIKKGEELNGETINDLRNFSFTILQSEWINEQKNKELLSLGTVSGSGKIIRVVTTSLSDSLAWEKKVIGYFVWWPEADLPWITTFTGSDSESENISELYPSSNFTGMAQDDDGIQNLSYKIEKQEDSEWNEYKEETEISLSETGTKYSAFAIQTPSENGIYKISFTVKDIYGKESTKIKYFKTLDVSPPKLNIKTPEDKSSILADSNGNITFSGIVSDDGSVKSLNVIYLNPLANDDTNNLIRYMSGNEDVWNLATTSGKSTEKYSFTKDGKKVEYSNKIYKIDLKNETYDKSEKLRKYDFSKTLNIFTDLGIDGENIPLLTQYFIFRAVDNGGTSTVLQFSLTGDTESPTLEINSVQQFASDGTSKIEEFTFNDNSVPTFAVVNSGDYAILKGTWSDNSVIAWNNDKSKIGEIDFSWNDATFEITSESVDSNGTWSWQAKVTNLPKKSGSITASLSDLAGNTKTVTKSIFVETAELGLESIAAQESNGSYNSGTIHITLDFTKNTIVDTTNGTPTLTLNNGGTATYVSGGESGSATSQHIFEYTISKSDSDTDALDVVSFNANGAIYKDASVTGGKEFTVELPTETAQTLKGSRNIKIDQTAPKIASLQAVSPAGYYKEGKTIIFSLSFNENVTISGASSLGLVFDGISPNSVTATESGSNIIFTYVVSAGENASSLSINSISNTSGVTVKDEAGNELSGWDVTSFTLGKNIVVDTNAPSAPTIVPDESTWGTKSLVTSATSFTISGTEDGATIEYSTDGGTSWLTYKNTAVNLSNNGTYNVTARQTDKAGNVSSSAETKTVTVEKGDFLDKITADTTSGTYSATKGGKVIGRIIFRKNITLPTDATVTLNVKNSSGTQYKPSLTKSSSATISGGADYTFTYTIQEGDYIENNAALNVTGWSFTSGTLNSATVDLTYSSIVESESGKRFSDNREIYILTGNPKVIEPIEITDENLTVTFDRNISKVGNSITLELSSSDSYSDTFIAPAVMSASEYSSSSSAIQAYYEAGQNGATLNSDNTLTNDTTTKYILKFDTEPTDSTLVSAFVNDGQAKVTIPVVASAVTVSGSTLTVDLSSAYKLPIMGAKYKLTIPEGSVTDAAQNTNEDYTTSVTSLGVEPPVIRINKGSQTITPGTSPNYTTGSSVTMPSTAKMRIDSQTPKATIYYGTTQKTPSAVSVVNSGVEYTTKTDDATVPDVSSVYNSAITLGSNVSSYSGAAGLKIAIASYAQSGTTKSSTSYEYATRTVLKLKISGGYSGDSDGQYNTSTAITESSTLKFGQLKVWVIGGDSAYGGNSITPFPLSWHDSSNFKLMASKNGFDSNMYCEWYWITWDVTTATYHGFVIGDVPSDAATNGPTQWYSGEGAWDSQKTYYVLYPGETLIMEISSSGTYSNGSFHWRTKNHGTR